jgi:hypothetical protein
MTKLFLVIFGIMGLCGNAAAESSVWVVRQGSFVTYLGGTCHVLRQDDYPLPVEFERAYQAAERIVFEADPGQINSSQMQQLLARKAFYLDGTTLEQVLEPATYQLLQDYCRRSNLPLSVFARLKPAMAALTLLSMELQRLGINQGGVDLYFYQRAVTDGKGREALETMEQQVEFMLGMAEGREDRFMQHSMGELERLDEVFDGLISAWRKGDEEIIAKLVAADFKEQFPEIFRTLFSERNAAWLSSLEMYIASPETELILVGVGHLVGEDGLLVELRKRGYRVEKMH